MIKINLGCGSQCPDNWINVDYSLGAKLSKLPLFKPLNKHIKLFDLNWHDKIFIHDLRKAFPWPDQHADVIYSSHTLEHLTKKEGQHFLHECHRVLKQNGIIRIIVPDLASVVTSYLDGGIAADDFIDTLGTGYEMPNDNRFKKTLAPLIRFPHKCMYDTARLKKIMCDIGFKCESRDKFKSDITDIETIESADRTINSVIIEGIKL